MAFVRYEILRKNEVFAVALFSNDGNMLDFSRHMTSRQLEIAPIAYRTQENNWLKKWWSERAIPLTRDQISDFLSSRGYNGPQEYLIRNLGLSLTDYYWIRPEGSALKWEDVNLFANRFHDDIFMPEKDMTDEHVPNYSPNSSLQGNIEKAWTIINGQRCLIKGNHSRFSTESINEVLAAKIHEWQGYDNYTPYNLIKITGKPYDYGCVSKAFTSQKLELVPAWAVCTSQPKDNNTSYYEHFIQIAVEHGADRELLERDLEYQIMTDFVMSGYDRHLNNVAMLRDADTLQFTRMAPIYDSGASMFVDRPFPASLRELERMPVTSFAPRESKLLKLVKNPSVIDLTKLPPSDYLKSLYRKDSQGQDNIIDKIVENYERKIDMCREVQLGIDPFHRKIIRNLDRTPQKFIMISGLPGSGKTEMANETASYLEHRGMYQIPVSAILSVHDVIDCLFPYTEIEEIKEVADRKDYLYTPNTGFTIISPNAVRDELARYDIYTGGREVFSIVDAQIHCALKNGISVIYEATNLDVEIRNHYLEIAKKLHVKEKQIILTEITVENACKKRPDIQEQSLREMHVRFTEANRHITAEWDVSAPYGTKHAHEYSKSEMKASLPAGSEEPKHTSGIRRRRFEGPEL